MATGTQPEVAATQGGVVRYGPYPELTWQGVLVGYLLGALICISIGYASLILGFSIEGSELAAILGWGVLRGVMRRTSIVENNINQTLASAVNGASAGMMFSVPALFILEKQYAGATDFSPVLMVLACIAGGIVGLAYVIPLRRQMIDFNRLAYPGGIAVAAILKSPGAGMRKAMLLIGGAVVSAAVHLAVIQFEPSENFALGDLIGAASFWNLTFYLSLLTVGVGFLSGRGGLYFGLGGFLCYWLLSPLLLQFGAPDVAELFATAGSNLPGALRGALFRPLGIGILIGAAVAGILAAFPLIRSAIRSMQDASAKKSAGGAGADELPIRFLYGAVVLGTLALIEWAASLKLFVYACVGFSLFAPWGVATESGGPLSLLTSIPVLVAKLALAGAGLALIETVSAKLRVFRAPEFLAGAFMFAVLGLLVHLLLGA
jgi:uncharacterized oligopeptide transporter (OPT) family protein